MARFSSAVAVIHRALYRRNSGKSLDIRYTIKRARTRSDDALFPRSAPEPENAAEREQRIGDEDGHERSSNAEAGMEAQEIGHGDLANPEAGDVKDGGRYGIARAVEGGGDHHSVGIRYVAITQKSKALHGDGNHSRIGCE